MVLSCIGTATQHTKRVIFSIGNQQHRASVPARENRDLSIVLDFADFVSTYLHCIFAYPPVSTHVHHYSGIYTVSVYLSAPHRLFCFWRLPRTSAPIVRMLAAARRQHRGAPPARACRRSAHWRRHRSRQGGMGPHTCNAERLTGLTQQCEQAALAKRSVVGGRRAQRPAL